MVKYFTDTDLINSLRKYYDEYEQYTIDFRYWLHTLSKIKDGYIVQIENRKFLIEEYTGSVIKEVK